MPIRLSSYYNDPSIGQGASNIAALFAPPSGTDLLNGAKIQDQQLRTSTLGDLIRRAADPNVDQGTLDRQAALIGSYAPSQSMTAVRLNNDTTRSTNAADNARAIQVAKLQEQGSLARHFASPVILGDGQTAYLPDQTQAATGLGPTLTGGVRLNSGQSFTRPDGSTLSGPEAAETEDGVKAAILRGMDPAMQRSVVFGNTPVERVVGPTGLPTFSTRMDALGQRSAPTDSGPSTVAKLQSERAALPPGDQRAAELTSAIDAAGRGQTPDTFRQTADADAAKTYSDMAKAGQRARSFESDIDTLGELLTDAPTGVTAPGRLKAAQYAQALGLNDVAAGLTGGKMDALTAANAIAQRMAPTLRVPGSGAQSDRELQNFLASIPSIATQPGGNQLILSTLRGGARYQQQVGEIAQRASRQEISRADADAQIAAVPTPFAAFSAARAAQPGATQPAPAAAPAPVRVASPDEARRLPSGTPIQLPDGTIGKVP